MPGPGGAVMHALLTPSLGAEFKRRLERERERIAAGLHARAEAEWALGRSQAEEGAAIGAPGDVATDLLDEEIDLGLAEAASARLGAVETALRRLATGEYGACARCGADIDIHRLWALPWASRCIRCAS